MRVLNNIIPNAYNNILLIFIRLYMFIVMECVYTIYMYYTASRVDYGYLLHVNVNTI